MTVVVFCAVLLLGVTQSATTKLFNKTQGGAFTFNFYKATSAFMPFLIIAPFGFSASPVTLTCALAYGVSLTLSMIAGYFALKSGPMALTCMLVSFSVAIPVACGLIFWNEELTAFKIAGLSALFLAMIIANANLSGRRKERNVLLWLFFVFVTFLANGVCLVVQKIQQTYLPGEETKEFMTIATAVSAVLFTAVAFIKEKPKAVFQSKGKIYGIISGLSNAGANFLTLLLIAGENASALFPAISAGTLILSLLCGTFVFKEKPKIATCVAIALGAAAVVFLKL